MHYCLPYKHATNIRHRLNLPKKLNLENSGINSINQIPILLPIWNLPGAMLSTLKKRGTKEKENRRIKEKPNEVRSNHSMPHIPLRDDVRCTAE